MEFRRITLSDHWEKKVAAPPYCPSGPEFVSNLPAAAFVTAQPAGLVWHPCRHMTVLSKRSAPWWESLTPLEPLADGEHDLTFPAVRARASDLTAP